MSVAFFSEFIKPSMVSFLQASYEKKKGVLEFEYSMSVSA
jgi:hypothetical protein